MSFVGTMVGGRGDQFAAKYAANGELQWIQRVGTDKIDVLQGIALDSEGDLLITGFTAESGLEGYSFTDAVLIKLSADGERLWTRVSDSGDEDMALAVATDTGDNAVTLQVSSQGGSLATYSPEGQMLWQVSLPFASTRLASLTFDSIHVDAAGNINVGSSKYPLNGAKFSGNGEPLERPEPLSDGRIIVAAPNRNLLAFIIDETSITRVEPSSAEVVWSAPLEEELRTSSGRNVRVALDASDNVFLLAATEDSNYVIAYSSTGERLWSKRFESAMSLSSIVAGKHGDVFISGGRVLAHFIP